MATFQRTTPLAFKEPLLLFLRLSALVVLCPVPSSQTLIMSQGTLYGDTETRCILPVGLVKAFNLDVALEKKGADAHKAAFPNGKVPAFIGQHGYKLQESIAVIYYCTYTL